MTTFSVAPPMRELAPLERITGNLRATLKQHWAYIALLLVTIVVTAALTALIIGSTHPAQSIPPETHTVEKVVEVVELEKAEEFIDPSDTLSPSGGPPMKPMKLWYVYEPPYEAPTNNTTKEEASTVLDCVIFLLSCMACGLFVGCFFAG